MAAIRLDEFWKKFQSLKIRNLIIFNLSPKIVTISVITWKNYAYTEISLLLCETLNILS